MNRREMLQKSLFGGIAAPLVINEISFNNSSIEEDNTHIAPKSPKAGALAIAFGSVRGSRDFALRQEGNRKAIATDGSLIYFVWPSERGDARGYIKSLGDTNPDSIVFRLRMGRPEAPYYLRWRKGDYYLYTPPGALVKRASLMIQAEDETAHVQALSDMRMAVLVNLAFRGNGQDIMDSLAELDSRIRQDVGGLRKYWQEYKELLTASRGHHLLAY
jgi:hypothetical protein